MSTLPLAAPVQAVQPPYGVTLPILPCQREHAILVAKGRSRANDTTRKPYQDLGSPSANLNADAWGALAEIALYGELERQGHRPDYKLLAARPVPRPDMLLDGIKYEIKACLPDKHYVGVNCAGHENPAKRPDFYVFCLFASAQAMQVCHPVPYAEVSGWKRMTNSHSPYYSVHKDTLRPLVALNALVTAADIRPYAL